MGAVVHAGLFGQHANLVRSHVVTDGGDVVNHTAAQASGFVLYQTSGSIAARDPMVDVGLDHEFGSDLSPQAEVHGSPLRLTQGCSP